MNEEIWPEIPREGYSGFLSLIWMLWKRNRKNRMLRVTTRLEITLPVIWFK